MSTTEQITTSSENPAGYYDSRYFAWQAPRGEFGGWANLIKFEDYIKPDDKVIDYGCGGGYLLKQLRCGDRLGIEINETARETATSLGVRVVSTAAEVPDEWADIIISNNALEHTTRPLDELRSLLPKLKRGGRIVFVVPNESIRCRYAPGDVNQHLYSWSPMSLGNLFTHAGFKVDESKPFLHKWPRNNFHLWARFGSTFFHTVCRAYARWERSWFQVRVIAHRPNA